MEKMEMKKTLFNGNKLDNAYQILPNKISAYFTASITRQSDDLDDKVK